MHDPEIVPEADHVVIESTYGNRRHDPADAVDALGEVIERTVQRAGTVVIPAFAVGRAQTLIHDLWLLREADRLRNVPVYLDSPMAASATVLLHNTPASIACAPTAKPPAAQVYVRDDRIDGTIGQPLAEGRLSASGPAAGGRVLHPPRLRPQPSNTLSPAAGRRHARAQAARRRTRDAHPATGSVHAEVARLPMLSAHADSDELMRWLSGFRRAPRVFIVHGEDDAGSCARASSASSAEASVPLPQQRQVLRTRCCAHGRRCCRRRACACMPSRAIAVMRAVPVCHAEGLGSRPQVLLVAGDREVRRGLPDRHRGFGAGQVRLSEAAWKACGSPKATLCSAPPAAVGPLAKVRQPPRQPPCRGSAAIVGDVVASRYTDVHLAAFLTATAALPLDEAETVALTRAMVEVGERLHWDAALVVDKHCVGGLPGNRTTPSWSPSPPPAWSCRRPRRAILAVGTADTMETLTPVDLDLARLRRVVETEGAASLGGHPAVAADDLFVRIERELDIDTEGQRSPGAVEKTPPAPPTSSSTSVGATAKVRSAAAAERWPRA